MQASRNIPIDPNPQETREWVDSLDSVFRFEGSERAAFLLAALNTKASELGVLSDELTKRNMEMFASEVMPHLR